MDSLDFARLTKKTGTACSAERGAYLDLLSLRSSQSART